MTTLVPLAAGESSLATGPALWIGLVLLILNGFFVAAEIALLAARQVRVEELAESGDRRAQRALKMLKELSITFSGAQLGITMASLGLGAVTEPALVGLLEGWLGPLNLPDGIRGALAFAIGLGIVVFLHMVVGEMAPKNLALAKPEEVSLRLARPFGWFVALLRPLIVALNGTANAVVRLVGVEPRDEIGLVHTPDELLLVVRESRRHGMLTPAEARVLTAALALSDIDAEAAMTPRVDIASIEDEAPVAEVLERSRSTGFTRLPVYHEALDNIVGLVHVKDVLIRERDELGSLRVADVMRPVAAVPESRDLENLLRDMRRDRSHAAVVVDEFGGTAGLITLEDVLEELVGEIADEFDPGAPLVRRLGERRWSVPGTLRLDELQRAVGVRLPDGPYETVSGYLTDRVGHLPEVGDVAEHEGWTLQVRTLEGRRAGEVVVSAPEPVADGQASGISSHH